MHVATTPSTGGHDIWQSASTGHQVSEAGGKSVSYNEARLAKLQAQFPARPNNTSTKHAGAPEALLEGTTPKKVAHRDSGHIPLFDYDPAENLYHPTQVNSPIQTSLALPAASGSGIFNGCVFYLDGYMGAKMSDHSLRRVLTQNGGRLSMYLQKTRITHVLLSSGGALANSKIRKEVEGLRNRVKFVKVDWVFRCLELGRRIGEWDYCVDRLCGGNRTVASMFSQQNTLHATDMGMTITKNVAQRPNESATLSTEKNIIHASFTNQPSLEGTQTAIEHKDRLDLLDAEEDERLDSLDR